ncbi:MAG: GTP 3',8-cyclase MoaA [Actinomycetota bacterium]|jgi:cyclic pyranopterin phosphate synthase|nr:GTP 3',8-cyclase MoaA [Actinomycetota bacterium]
MAHDSHGRTIDYLRISVTDRCNLRCVYCMPPEGIEWKPMEGILSFEEIERFAAIAVENGIRKIRLTGGEPLVRKGLVGHVRRLRAITGLDSIALTTNAILLPKYAQQLRDAGLSRVNISLDSLDPDVYAEMTRGGRLQDALDGLDTALEVGFKPVKLNVVVVRSLEQDLASFAKLAIDRPIHVRFIEYMPVGDANAVGARGHQGCWTEADHVPSDEIIETLGTAMSAQGLGPIEAVHKGQGPEGWGPARYFTMPASVGTLGVISPLSRHFCGECNRLRLTADGRIRPCLFSDREFDVKTALREGTDREVNEVIAAALREKPETHEQRRGTVRGMSQIGG